VKTPELALQLKQPNGQTDVVYFDFVFSEETIESLPYAVWKYYLVLLEYELNRGLNIPGKYVLSLLGVRTLFTLEHDLSYFHALTETSSFKSVMTSLSSTLLAKIVQLIFERKKNERPRAEATTSTTTS
jgi:hypothetical protein